MDLNYGFLNLKQNKFNQSSLIAEAATRSCPKNNVFFHLYFRRIPYFKCTARNARTITFYYMSKIIYKEQVIPHVRVVMFCKNWLFNCNKQNYNSWVSIFLFQEKCKSGPLHINILRVLRFILWNIFLVFKNINVRFAIQSGSKSQNVKLLPIASSLNDQI